MSEEVVSCNHAELVQISIDDAKVYVCKECSISLKAKELPAEYEIVLYVEY